MAFSTNKYDELKSGCIVVGLHLNGVCVSVDIINLINYIHRDTTTSFIYIV